MVAKNDTLWLGFCSLLESKVHDTDLKEICPKKASDLCGMYFPFSDVDYCQLLVQMNP